MNYELTLAPGPAAAYVCSCRGALGLKAGGLPGQTDGLPLGNRVLAKMEQDYDEEFTLDTQVRIKEIGEGTPNPKLLLLILILILQLQLIHNF
jgi:hypothetical protein